MIGIDSVGDQPVSGDQPVVIARRSYVSDAMAVVGWSVDPVDHQPVRGVLVAIDGVAAGQPGGVRLDP